MLRRSFSSLFAASCVLALVACAPANSQNSESGANDTADQASQTAAVPEVTVDQQAVAGQPLMLKVKNGTFGNVELTNDDNDTVGIDSGEVNADSATQSPASSATPAADASAAGTVWQSHYQLAGKESYTWTATVIDETGQEHTQTGTVKTDKATGQASRVSTVIADDQTVGVGAPIILMFAGTVDKKYRGAVENRLSVSTTDKDGKKIDIEGSWAWLYDTDGHSRIHYRTKEFWPAHTKVSVQALLEGVNFSDSTQGAKDLSLDFEIGREQIVEANAKNHTMVVKRDGKKVNEYPASLGAPKSPSFNGTHIVMSKAVDYTMTSETWGYSTPVKYAVRIHNNGEFIHAAPWSVGSQGRANVSHGCVNLSTANAAEYFDTAIYGDPVEISGSSVNLSTEDSDVSDWVYEWDEWQDLSALENN